MLIGVPGLRWGDVKPQRMPVVWRMAGRGAIANIAVRGVSPRSCAADGWLTISAGTRAQPVHGDCAPPPRPRRKGTGATVPGFADLRSHNATSQYAAQVGLLGDAVHRAGGCTAAVEPGGALAMADSSGRVDHYRSDARDIRARDLRRCLVTVVGVDDVARPPGDRAAALARTDRQIGEVLDRVPDSATVLLVGVADAGTQPGLRVTIDTRPASTLPAYLKGTSTRRQGLVTLTDVTPTVLRLAGVPVPREATGSPWAHGTPASGGRPAAIKRLQEQDLAARITRALVAPFNIALVAGQLVAYGLATLAWRRARGLRRRQVLVATRCVALIAASAPVATYLANSVPWWRAEHPSAGLITAVLAASLAVATLALIGPWRHRPLGPVTAVAAVTALTLAADAIVGSPLQADSLNGNFSLVAGRFYGFGNLTFALFATASLICAAGLAEHATATGRRRRAVALAGGVGGAAIVIDGWPGWGSDVGGVLSLTPGVALLTLWAAGHRITLRPVLAAGAGGILLVTGLASLDHRRSDEQRSHLGRFWGRLVDGGARQVIERKTDSMLNSLGSVWLTLASALTLIALMSAMLRRNGVLGPLFHQAPALRVALSAVLATAVAGFAVNDSGIAVLAVTGLIAAPLTLTAALSNLEKPGPPT